MHFVNNASIVLIASIPALRAWLEGGGEAPPWVLLPPALLAVAVGVRLLSRESYPAESESEAAKAGPHGVKAEPHDANAEPHDVKPEPNYVKAESDDVDIMTDDADSIR